MLCGVLIRHRRRAEIAQAVATFKQRLGLDPASELSTAFDGPQQAAAIHGLVKFQAGLIAIVSNKRNMRRFRNKRVEAKNLEVVRGGRIKPQNCNWFYNYTFRYLLERASAECGKWTVPLYGAPRPIRIIFSRRKHFCYSQTQAYLHKLRVERRGRGYFNNKRQIQWSVVDPSSIESARAKAEPGLQFADCVASTIYRAVDEDWFGVPSPGLLEDLAPRFLRDGATPFGYGFTLLPERFQGPLTTRQCVSACNFDPLRRGIGVQF